MSYPNFEQVTVQPRPDNGRRQTTKMFIWTATSSKVGVLCIDHWGGIMWNKAFTHDLARLEFKRLVDAGRIVVKDPGVSSQPDYRRSIRLVLHKIK